MLIFFYPRTEPGFENSSGKTTTARILRSLFTNTLLIDRRTGFDIDLSSKTFFVETGDKRSTYTFGSRTGDRVILNQSTSFGGSIFDFFNQDFMPRFTIYKQDREKYDFEIKNVQNTNSDLAPYVKNFMVDLDQTGLAFRTYDKDTSNQVKNIDSLMNFYLSLKMTNEELEKAYVDLVRVSEDIKSSLVDIELNKKQMSDAKKTGRKNNLDKLSSEDNKTNKRLKQLLISESNIEHQIAIATVRKNRLEDKIDNKYLRSDLVDDYGKSITDYIEFIKIQEITNFKIEKHEVYIEGLYQKLDDIQTEISRTKEMLADNHRKFLEDINKLTDDQVDEIWSKNAHLKNINDELRKTTKNLKMEFKKKYDEISLTKVSEEDVNKTGKTVISSISKQTLSTFEKMQDWKWITGNPIPLKTEKAQSNDDTGSAYALKYLYNLIVFVEHSNKQIPFIVIDNAFSSQSIGKHDEFVIWALEKLIKQTQEGKIGQLSLMMDTFERAKQISVNDPIPTIRYEDF